MKRISVITGTRAEFGLLRPLIDRIKMDKDLKLQLVVTGMHLSPEFGLTYREIEEDGYAIDETIEMQLSSDTAVGISKSIGLGIIGFADAYQRLRPDVVVILGDRYEVYASSIAALVAGIPIAHIYGGETGAGTIDNMIRHAITKMSHLHFTSTEAYRKRVVQLGEHPDTVYNVGSLGIENLKKIKLLSKTELENEINFKIDSKTILVTFHPLSLEPTMMESQTKEMLTAFDKIADLKVIFTKSNSDTGGRVINSMIDDYVSNHIDSAISFYSLGTRKFLSAAKYVKAVVGNSSSGIIEVPSLGTFTLNIGKRQEGRIQGNSIINCKPKAEDIYFSLTSILERPDLKEVENPYEGKNTSAKIVEILKEKISTSDFVDKKFYDLDF